MIFFPDVECQPVFLDISWLMELIFLLYTNNDETLHNNGRITSLAMEVPLFTMEYIEKLLHEKANSQQVILE